MDGPTLDLASIRSATDDFALRNKLGEGGFGVVYRGQLPDGREIAVKRLSRNTGKGSTQFVNEVQALATLQHRNLVHLLGGLLEGEEKILVYEYAINGSLDNFLLGGRRKEEEGKEGGRRRKEGGGRREAGRKMGRRDEEEGKEG
ncbi:Inactive protein kinase [Nymphaea thermarum]|nr:Inactive protein kinase [Nymphaea thermarum]